EVLQVEDLPAEEVACIGSEGRRRRPAQVPAGDLLTGALLEPAVAQTERSAIAVDNGVTVKVERDIGGGDDKGGALRADISAEDVGGAGLVEDVGTGTSSGEPGGVNRNRVRDRERWRDASCVVAHLPLVPAQEGQEAAVLAGSEEPHPV